MLCIYIYIYKYGANLARDEALQAGVGGHSEDGHVELGHLGVI